MKGMLWRVVYAVLCVVMFLMIIPLFAAVVGFPLTGQVWELIRDLGLCTNPDHRAGLEAELFDAQAQCSHVANPEITKPAELRCFKCWKSLARPGVAKTQLRDREPGSVTENTTTLRKARSA